MNAPEKSQCPLCNHTKIDFYHRDNTREYFNCPACNLVFVPPPWHLSADDEKTYYDLHENQLDDPGYRRFLDRLFSPLNQRLKPASKGLDFGCGPGPALAKMFEEAGHTVALYDPHYAPDKTVLSANYDFITLSEVAEHLTQPGRDLDTLWDLLADDGWLAIMTKRVRDHEAFKTWHYITDPTHISFFSDTTFQTLADHWGQEATLTIVGADVVLFHKEKP